MSGIAVEEYIGGLWSILDSDSGVQDEFPTYRNNITIVPGSMPDDIKDGLHGDIQPPFADPHTNEYSNKKSNPTKPQNDIRIFHPVSLSREKIYKGASAVYDALHDQPTKLSDELPNRNCKALKCVAPTVGNSTEDFFNLIVQVRANLDGPLI